MPKLVSLQYEMIARRWDRAGIKHESLLRGSLLENGEVWGSTCELKYRLQANCEGKHLRLTKSSKCIAPLPSLQLWPSLPPPSALLRLRWYTPSPVQQQSHQRRRHFVPTILSGYAASILSKADTSTMRSRTAAIAIA
jgi:hypothetical protein